MAKMSKEDLASAKQHWHGESFQILFDHIDALERDQSAREAAVLEMAAVQCGLMHMYVRVGESPRLEYLGFDHQAAAASIRALKPDSALDDLLRKARREARADLADRVRRITASDPDNVYCRQATIVLNEAVAELRSAPRTEGQ